MLPPCLHQEEQQGLILPKRAGRLFRPPAFYFHLCRGTPPATPDVFPPTATQFNNNVFGASLRVAPPSYKSIPAKLYTQGWIYLTEGGALHFGFKTRLTSSFFQYSKKFGNQPSEAEASEGFCQPTCGVDNCRSFSLLTAAHWKSASQTTSAKC